MTKYLYKILFLKTKYFMEEKENKKKYFFLFKFKLIIAGM